MANKTESRAWEIIEHHKNKVSSCPELLSLVLTGSLTNGSYTGNAGSDIDFVHVLRDDAPEGAKEKMNALMAETERETDRDLPLARCVYRFSELRRPYNWDFTPGPEKSDYIELPIEIVRMKESGKVILGENVLDLIDMPSREDMLMVGRKSEEQNEILKKLNPEFWEQYQKSKEEPTDRILAQIVLCRAMKDIYFGAGVNCSSKRDVVTAIEKHMPSYPHIRLLNLAKKWRYEPDNFTESDSAEMQSLYRLWHKEREGKAYDYVPGK